MMIVFFFSNLQLQKLFQDQHWKYSINKCRSGLTVQRYILIYTGPQQRHASPCASHVVFCKTWYCYKGGWDTRVFVCVHWQSSDHADQHKHLPPEDGERTLGYKKDAEIKRGKNPTRSKDRKTEEAGRLHVGRNGAVFFSPFHQHFYFLFGGTDVVDYSLLLQRRFLLVLLVFIVFKGVGARRCRFIEHSKTDNMGHSEL